MQNKVGFFIVLGLWLMAMQFADAEESGWYGGFAVGQGDLKTKLSDWDDSTLLSGDIAKDNPAYKVYAGYRITPRYWIETGYLDFADVTMTGQSSGGYLWNKGAVAGSIHVLGLNVSGVAAQPIAAYGAFFVKAGIFFWDSTMIQNPTILGEFKNNDDGIDFSFGAGAEFRIYQKWKLRGEWEHVGVTFASVQESSATLASLGLLWDF